MPIHKTSTGLCLVCLEKHLIYNRAVQDAYRRNGLCIVCGARKENETRLCDKHRESQRQAQRRRDSARRLERQKRAQKRAEQSEDDRPGKPLHQRVVEAPGQSHATLPS